jgi:DNA-binding transcriptional LysR family regulator
MPSLRALLPSAGALVVFEAAARHGSFTRAAGELSMSQAAVSHAVKQLDGVLGRRLFNRLHLGVELTGAGERFFQDVSIGLAHIRRSAEAIRRTREARHVTFSTSTAFAAFWMLPRLPRLRERHPDIDLRLQATDKDVDLAAEGLSLGVRRCGAGDWPGCGGFLLAEEAIWPVCSPGYLARAGRPAEPADLLRHTLIHLEEPFRPRPTWRDWFAGQGVAFDDRGEGLRLNDYALVLQAALAGQGVALGWQHLTAGAIAKGQLVRALDRPLRTGMSFRILWPLAGPLSAEAAKVREWLRGEASLDPP